MKAWAAPVAGLVVLGLLSFTQRERAEPSPQHVGVASHAGEASPRGRQETRVQPHPVDALRVANEQDTPAPDPRDVLQREGLLVDMARQLLDARDVARAELLLSYARTGAFLATADADALALAVDCLREPDGEARTDAACFLEDTHGSRLRKSLRRACFAPDQEERSR